MPPSKVLSLPLTGDDIAARKRDGYGDGRLLVVGKAPPPPPIWDTLRSIDSGVRLSRAAKKMPQSRLNLSFVVWYTLARRKSGGVITIIIGGRWGNFEKASPSKFLEAEDGVSTTTAATARPMDCNVDRTTTMTTIL